MFNKCQTILATRPAAMVLALILFAGFTAPFVLLQHAYAADPALPCTEGNYNGCTELSPVPPEDPQAVPPNVVLMLDDSGSMNYDYMPDWGDLSNTTQWGVRNAAINGVYYNPATVYTPPPRADGTLYPDSPGLTNAYFDGFTDTATKSDVTSYRASDAANFGHRYYFGNNLPTTLFNNTDVDKGAAVWGGGTAYIPGKPGSPAKDAFCPAGYRFDPADSSRCIRDPVATTGRNWTCNSGDTYFSNNAGKSNQCRHRVRTESGNVDTWYDATDGGPTCPSGANFRTSDGLCHYPAVTPTPAQPATPPTDPIAATPNYMWTCPSGGTTNPAAPAPPSTPPRCVATTNTRITVWAFVYVVGTPVQANAHVVVPNDAGAPAGGWCAVLVDAWAKKYCVSENDISGAAAPSTTSDGKPLLAQNGASLTAGQNIANWFSYYRTRMLMAKSGVMTAFTNLDPKYRVGFASINANVKSSIPTSPTPYTFDDATTGGGDSNNKLAVVQPFGDGKSGTQKANFWTWLASAAPANNTPLRKALQGAGEYYKTDQPWSAMSGDPGYTTGSTTRYACRASYTILTTDGFWNGNDPSGIGTAAATDGPVHSVPAGNVAQYTAAAPFSGGGASGGVSSLADVATYYWETDLSDMPNEVAPSTADPASWQHMTTYTVGLGYNPKGISPATATMSQIFAWARGGTAISPFSWPTPASGDINNIADLAHAAVNGRGDFFNANNPQQLADAFAKAITDIGARNVPPTPAAVNASVLSVGSLAFRTGYSTGDWSGAFDAVTLKTDSTVDQVLWKGGALLDGTYHSTSNYNTRTVFTGAYKTGTFSSFQLTAANKDSLDTTQTAGLQTPALMGGDDTLENRINYLLGDNTYEGTSTGTTYRSRTSILGAIIRSDPVYVAGATGNYRDRWPTIGTIVPPETATGAQSYGTFLAAQATRAGMVYMGASDGMLHAFRAPVPKCTGTIDTSGNCSAYTAATGSGTEAWAFVPRAVYANLGNFTDAANFQFLPTLDATPVTRDVYSAGDKKWHTLLAGGVGLGGRGVYALDVTNPDPADPDSSKRFSASDILWEFDSDMAVATDCVASYGVCKGTDMGYTVAQPNIGRLANGKWVVLMPNGYFPDCSTPDMPTNDAVKCKVIADQVPRDAAGNPYSALFVFDALTGKMIAELKTPVGLGVTSFGLATPVMGDYSSDQVDDVAFAGDVQGNLWRFDLSDTNPANWAVTLAYEGVADGGHQGVQPITTRPRLFPDPATNRFMVVFGTGKYLGFGDNSVPVGVRQAIYGIRDVAGTTFTRDDLTQQFLHETVVPDGQPHAGASLRCVTGGASDTCASTSTAINTLPASGGGWYFDLYTTSSAGTLNNSGERVVVNPAAIFASNTVIFQSLITGAESSDACNPSTQGAVLSLNAVTGGPAGMSALGGWPVAGGRITNARTRGNLPLVSPVGGGRAYLPGALLGPSGSSPISLDAPIWRRRAWRALMNDQ